MSGMRAVLDVSTLFEDVWTGISNVVAAMAERALSDQEIDWLFTYETVPLPRTLIKTFLSQRSGAGGLEALTRSAWETGPIPSQLASELVAVFPFVKPVRRYFRKEAMVVHDLSTLLVPQFHSDENINHFANRIRHDIESSDHLFCVSNATMTDVHAYFHTPMERMSVIRLGAEFAPEELSAGLLQVRPDIEVEPYVVVLGTLEPRKNGGIVFDYLVQHPAFASQFRVVFVGRNGWLNEKQRLMQRLEGVGISTDRIHFTGFVSDAERTALMQNSAFCIYPSFFEGFGLPVLEAGALGKITVCSNSSSMPEVFPEQCVFFDPGDIFEFSQAIRIAQLRAAQTRSGGQSLSDILERTSPHGWDPCYAEIKRWVKEQ